MEDTEDKGVADMANLWKDLAQEKGLTFYDKSIYGWLNGCFVTLGFLLGEMRFHIYVPALPASQEQPTEEQQRTALLRAEAARALEGMAKEYKLINIHSFSGEQSLGVEFRGRSLKDMKRLGEFMDRATQKVVALGLVSEKTCSVCHQSLESGEVPVKIKGNVFPMHDSCAETIIRDVAWGKVEKKGSVLTGVLGAALAAVVGAIPWAAVFALGYMASIVGILIGFLVGKGYDLLHGRQGRVKIVIVLLFVLLSVALGQVAGTSYNISQYYDETKATLKPYEEMIYTKTEAIYYFWTEDLMASPDAMREVFGNFGLGVFFALLGCFGTLLKIATDTAPLKPKRMTVPL